MSRGIFAATGGGDEIGGSRYIYDIDGTRFGFDCGLRPLRSESDVHPVLLRNKELEKFIEDSSLRPSREQIPDLNSYNVTDLILTHGHLDHVGAVPLLTRKHRYLKIYSTEATRDICRLHWFETIKIAERNKEVPIFTTSDAEHALSRFTIFCPGRETKLNDSISLLPVDAHHILGSVSVVIMHRGKAVGFHSGDMFCDHSHINDLPEAVKDGVEFMTIDSTRLTEKNPPRDSSEEECKKLIRQAYESGKSIRFLTFAIDRAQTAYSLAREACPNADIWIDGQARQASEIYSRYLNGALAGITSRFVKDKAHRTEIISARKPNIAIVSSAMCFGGNAKKYILNDCDQKDRLYINLGWLDPCSPEYAFFESNRNDVFRFGTQTRPRFCDVARFNLTRHCDGDGILEKKAELKAGKIILVHGESSKMDRFIEDNPDGFVKGTNGLEISI